jgi:very-short-patch-repair endonuclease
MKDKHPLTPPVLKARARALRCDSTVPERMLWDALRGSKLAGLKFRRQHPIPPFVVDFYCEEEFLAVELDGDSHIGHAGADESRTAELMKKELKVIRFDNDDVLNDLEAVLRAILMACNRDPVSCCKLGQKTLTPALSQRERGQK